MHHYTPGYECKAKICPYTKEYYFPHLAKTPKSICFKCLVLPHTAVKMPGCETIPEFNTIPLDRESHSFPICLRIQNHSMCDKSMLHINSCKLQMENTGNFCSSYLL